MLLLTLPKAPRCDIADIDATARRAVYAIRPAQLDQQIVGHFGVREVLDGFGEGTGFVRHVPNISRRTY